MGSDCEIIGEDIAGVCIFEWIDEWWKSGTFEKQDANIEDHWGILTGYREPKPGYEIIKSIYTRTKDNSNGFSRDIFQKV